MSALRWFSALLLALVLVAGAALLLQRQVTAQLREEIALLREDHREIARLRTENQRLVAAQVSETELERLRADRAAVVRLRGEIEKVKDNIQARERALAELVANEAAIAPPPTSPAAPALALLIGMNADGSLSLDGSPVEIEMLRSRLAGLPWGSQFEIRLRTPSAQNEVNFENVKRNVERIAEMAKGMSKERGLKMSLRQEPSAKE